MNLFDDSSYIQRQKYSGGGHNFSEYARYYRTGVIGNLMGHLLKCGRLCGNFINISDISNVDKKHALLLLVWKFYAKTVIQKNVIMGGSRDHIGFLSNTSPDHWKWQSYQASIQCRVIISTPAFRWRADDGPLIVLFGSSNKKKRCKVGPPLAKLSGSVNGYGKHIKVLALFLLEIFSF